MHKRSKRGWVCLVLIVIWFVGRNANVVVIQFGLADGWIAMDNISHTVEQPINGLTDDTKTILTLASRRGSPVDPSKPNTHPEYHITENENNGINSSNRLTLKAEDGDKGTATTSSGRSHRGNVTILKSMKPKWITASHTKRIMNETIMGEEYSVLIQASNKGKIRSRQSVTHKLREKFQARHNFAKLTHIDRIYYINMDHRHLKRAIMESWLSQQDIPYSRVAAKSGQTDSCVPKKRGPRCIGISGLAQSNVFIMDKLETKGITLVIEDDFVIRDMSKLLASVQLVPPDWDVLRWDCWDEPLPHFPRYPFSFQLAPIDNDICKNVKHCWFCGGTHVVMWKGGESLEKLRRLWGTPPHDGIDCQLIDPSIKTYCIQIGVGEFHSPLVEPSDIPKFEGKPKLPQPSKRRLSPKKG